MTFCILHVRFYLAIFSLDLLLDPHSLWSLWVPGVLLLTIVAAAVYFARIRI